MDNREEQASEVEALMSIYPNEITMISEDPYQFTISLGSNEDIDIEDETAAQQMNGYSFQLKFILPPEYPGVIPLVEIDENETNLGEEQVEELKGHLDEQANENIGMVMVFTLVSAALEWTTSLWETGLRDVRDKEIQMERQRLEEEEAERNRFEGTRVTVATFMAWKATFDVELAQKRKEAEASLPDSEKNISKKLTGRELFVRDKNLYASDILGEDEAEFDDKDFVLDDGSGSKAVNVPIDESLFEDLDDLELEDDDD